jgi:aryl-alcohol dehydrogenase-like predicted oxidoreductase
MAACQLTKALWKSDVEDYERFEVTQPLFHAGYRDDVKDYLDVCADQDMAVCPYSPLAGGFLTGKYERTDDDDPTAFEGPEGARGSLSDRFEDFYLSERGWHVLDELRAVADELDATPAQVALRWLIEQPDITCVPIVGARTVDQLDENVGATDISLSDDQFNRIVSARYAEDGERWGHRE